jgi:hypothetical protein
VQLTSLLGRCASPKEMIYHDLLSSEVRRILLLRHWVNKGERKAGDLLWDPRHIMESNFT